MVLEYLLIAHEALVLIPDTAKKQGMVIYMPVTPLLGGKEAGDSGAQGYP